jgi:hypothetical protein
MTDDQTLNILIGILFLIVIGVIRHNRGIGWG